jgi:hypothetical protein
MLLKVMGLFLPVPLLLLPAACDENPLKKASSCSHLPSLNPARCCNAQLPVNCWPSLLLLLVVYGAVAAR